jgi:oligopeptide/dipeptide ABC transporter ATP-binding protein
MSSGIGEEIGEETGAVLTVRDLVHEFPPRNGSRKNRGAQALRGVDLDLHPGECLGLVGESGSGKSTLARSLLRLIQPSSGSVLFKGVEVLDMPPRELKDFRSKVQIVFQDPFGSLNPRLRAGPMLEEVLRVHSGDLSSKERGERVSHLLESVGLSTEATLRFPHEFSGGQRQRLGIARAMAVEPEILILDEPVSALDLSVQAQILNLLGELRVAHNLTYLLVSHDLSVVRHAAERVAVMYLGRVVEVGDVSEVFRHPFHPYTEGLLAAAEPVAVDGSDGSDGRKGDLLWGEPPSPVDPPTGCALNPRCHHLSKDQECLAKTPPLKELEIGRHVACWKAGKHPMNP